MPYAFVVSCNLYDYSPRQMVLPFAVIVLGQVISQRTSFLLEGIVRPRLVAKESGMMGFAKLIIAAKAM